MESARQKEGCRNATRERRTNMALGGRPLSTRAIGNIHEGVGRTSDEYIGRRLGVTSEVGSVAETTSDEPIRRCLPSMMS